MGSDPAGKKPRTSAQESSLRSECLCLCVCIDIALSQAHQTIQTIWSLILSFTFLLHKSVCDSMCVRACNAHITRGKECEAKVFMATVLVLCTAMLNVYDTFLEQIFFSVVTILPVHYLISLNLQTTPADSQWRILHCSTLVTVCTPIINLGRKNVQPLKTLAELLLAANSL